MKVVVLNTIECWNLPATNLNELLKKKRMLDLNLLRLRLYSCNLRKNAKIIVVSLIIWAHTKYSYINCLLLPAQLYNCSLLKVQKKVIYLFKKNHTVSNYKINLLITKNEWQLITWSVMHTLQLGMWWEMRWWITRLSFLFRNLILPASEAVKAFSVTIFLLS